MFADLNSDNQVDETEILQQNHYYPFGMNMEGSWSGGTNKYQYNGKVMPVGADITDPKGGGLGMEYVTDFGLEVNIARFRTFDPAIGRFYQVDPEIEQFEEWSPYSSNLNNPISNNDPDGDCPKCLKALAKTVIKSVAKGKLDLGEIYDVVDNAATILNPNSSWLERGEAAFNLVSPVSTKEAKAIGKAVGVVDDAKDAKKAADVGKAAKTFDGKQSTESVTGKEAFGKAKEANGIPRSQQPDNTIKPNTPEGKAAGLDSRNVRQYEFTNSKGEKVTIRQDKPAKYNDGGKGDQEPLIMQGSRVKAS